MSVLGEPITSEEPVTREETFEEFCYSLAQCLVLAAAQPDFQAMVRDESRVRALNILGKEEPFDAERAEGAARGLVADLTNKLKILLPNALVHYVETCQNKDQLFETLCAMANTEGGLVELDSTLSLTIDPPAMRSPFLKSGGQPMLIPLHISSGQWILLVGRTPRLCFTPDGRAYHRVGGKSEPVPGSGQGLAYRKEAQSEELCLGIHVQAATLAELFAHNRREFCFALFGQWGRGKTELANLLQESLKEQGFHSILFSAWRHPSTPELWAHLYESFVKTVHDNTPLQGFPITLRAAILRYGLWPATFILLQLGFVLLGLKGQLAGMYHLYSVVGLSGLFFLWRVFRSHTLIQRLVNRYGHLPRHQEKLGLHSTIGEDLRCLLKGWQPFERIGYSGIGECIALLAYGLAGSGVAWILLPQGDMSSHLLEWFVFGLWWLIPAVTLLLPFVPSTKPWRNPQPQRFLLVVDDLDRCDPDIMLHIMESLKLMLEIGEIKSQLQVLMLVDERILRHAILQKHACLLNKSPHHQTPFFHPDQIVRENFEKLFTGHFRLLPLTDKEIDAVVEKLKMAAAQENLSSTIGPALSEQPGHSAAAMHAPLPEQTGTEGSKQNTTSVSSATQKTTTSQELYTEEEWKILRQYLHELSKHGGYTLPGPRSVRYLIRSPIQVRMHCNGE